MAKKAKAMPVVDDAAPLVIGDHPTKPEVVAKGLVESPDDLIKITIPVSVKIKRQMLRPGTHVVPRHQVDTIIEMVNKKQRADISIFTGNNYLVERMMDRTLVVSKVESLDMNKVVRR